MLPPGPQSSRRVRSPGGRSRPPWPVAGDRAAAPSPAPPPLARGPGPCALPVAAEGPIAAAEGSIEVAAGTRLKALEPRLWRQLSVWPLMRVPGAAPPGLAYALLGEALEDGFVGVEVSPLGSIRLENRAPQAVLLLVGEELRGDGWSWRLRDGLRAPSLLVPAGGELLLREGIELTARRTGRTHSPALLREVATEAWQALRPCAGQCGFAVAIWGQLVAVEVVSRPEALPGLLRQRLPGHLVAALRAPRRSPRGDGVRVESPGCLSALLAAVRAGRPRPARGLGHGRPLSGSSQQDPSRLEGWALGLDSECIHLRLAPAACVPASHFAPPLG